MSENPDRDFDVRLKRLEALARTKRSKPKPKPKPEPQGLYIDAKAVRASMAEKGWNQSDLARQMGVGKDRISVWLSGKNRPSFKHWAVLVQFVDIV